MSLLISMEEYGASSPYFDARGGFQHTFSRRRKIGSRLHLFAGAEIVLWSALDDFCELA